MNNNGPKKLMTLDELKRHIIHINKSISLGKNSLHGIAMGNL